MPTRLRLALALLSAAVAMAGEIAAQEVPSSSYRLRDNRGFGQQVRVDDEGEPASGAMASLSDEETVPTEVDDEPAATAPRPATPQSEAAHPKARTTPVWPRKSLPGGQERQSLKLSPRSESGRQLARPSPVAELGSLGTVGGALAVVLGVFVVIVWITRRVGPSGSAPLPREAVELLGRTTVSGQHALQLVRVGSRLVLVALSPQGATTLAEITDPHEVERLTAVCLRQRSGSSTDSFAQTVAQLERESTGRSFIDQRRPASGSAARSRNVARA